ncbi:MAG: F0F1 ATP synthase subunit B [Syntrophales bacterium]|nr:F0F1 ATP synthase subunit B [Syntrophales bacterium]
MKILFYTVAIALIAVTEAVAGASQEEYGGSSLWPFVFQVINFLLLLFVLYKLALPRAKGFFAERSQKIHLSLKEAEEAKSLAEKKLREYEEKLIALDREVEDIRNLAEKEGQAEKERIIAEAEKEAESLKKQAKGIAEQEIRRAKEELRREVARLSLEKAEKIIKDTIKESDQECLIVDYTKEITSPPC